eukprot:TRINITY_DN4768_c0_g1_i1.p1 TRINITY_DN4768_c0_g1~~TRINITY_DN4768_c0_g1_i1.p1  ORF type:complete len:512 (+),score=68.91 TRINITY_DN4768_c0_g1_i1:65-1600(+)
MIITYKFLLFILFFNYCSAQLIVETNDGYVKGFLRGNVRNFLGIPFASPPLNALRWKPTVPPQPWDGVRDCTQYALPCKQQIGPQPFTETSEDCLYLNVFAPTNYTYPMPVTVWIYGGGFNRGATILFPGTHLADITNSIVVTISYRLNVFGFLVLENFMLSEDKLVNFGLLDQQMALLWVKKNIAFFGGDNSRIQIFGESAGGASVLFHLVMPSSWPLYSTAVLESPAPSIYANCTVAQKIGVKYAATKGCQGTQDEILSCLYKLSSDELVEYNEDEFNPYLVPCHDPSQEFSDNVFKLISTPEKYNKVPMIIGTNKDEGYIFTYRRFNCTPPCNVSDAVYESLIRTYFGSLGDLVIQWYSEDRAQNGNWVTIAHITGDFGIRCVTDIISSLIPTPSLVFRYEFVRTPVNWAFKSLGATHTVEIPFVFNDPTMLFNFGSFSPDEDTLSQEMVQYWSNLAHTGSVNGGFATNWPTLDQNRGLIFDVGPLMTANINFTICALWRDVILSLNS